MPISDEELRRMSSIEVEEMFPGEGEDREMRIRWAKVKGLHSSTRPKTVDEAPDPLYKIPGFTSYDPGPIMRAALAIRDRMETNTGVPLGRPTMAKIVGVSETSVLRMETNASYIPRPKTLLAYAALADKLLMHKEAKLFHAAAADTVALFVARSKRKLTGTMLANASDVRDLDVELEKRHEEQ